uniref:ATP-binding protein n=1 Tax=Nocardiopsis gilva TaxID=280236 RepID=UPI00047784AB
RGSLDRLAELVSGARQAGLDVGLEGAPVDGNLPDAVELSTYRIVQESLSNAGRHAPGSEVSVVVDRAPGRLIVRVVNGPADGGAETPAPADFSSGGHGLVGMRERAAMLGGWLRAGPLADGGFEVHAELPVSRERG